MTDKEVKELVLKLWKREISSVDAAHILKGKGITAEQFWRATEEGHGTH